MSQQSELAVTNTGYFKAVTKAMPVYKSSIDLWFSLSKMHELNNSVDYIFILKSTTSGFNSS